MIGLGIGCYSVDPRPYTTTTTTTTTPPLAMDLHFPVCANLRPSPSSSSNTKFPPPPQNPNPNRRRNLAASPAKKTAASPRLQREPKRDLSRILITEAAILGVERKAHAATSTRLWPRAVLEALDDAVANNRWESALKIFKLLRKQHWYQPRCQTYAKLLIMLGKCRQPDQASALFKVMLSEKLTPALDVYTALVSAYGHSGHLDDAFQVLDQMKAISDCKPNAYTYTTLIHCCCRFRRFDRIPALLAEMSYSGVESTTVTYNAIVDGYGKAGMLDEMEDALSDMLEDGTCLPDRCTLNSIIWAYGNNRVIDKMENWYDEFRRMGVEPDLQTFNILIKSYGKAGAYEKLGSTMKFMKKWFFSPTVVTFNIVIECFGRAGDIERMEYFFRAMKYEGVKPNSITYCSLVSGYSKAGILEKVPAIIRQTENTDVVLDTPFFNCVINAYGQAGEVEIMKEMLLLMKEKNCRPDTITFATMIQAYRSKGMNEAAREMEFKMNEMASKKGIEESEEQRMIGKLSNK